MLRFRKTSKYILLFNFYKPYIKVFIKTCVLLTLNFKISAHIHLLHRTNSSNINNNRSTKTFQPSIPSPSNLSDGKIHPPTPQARQSHPPHSKISLCFSDTPYRGQQNARQALRRERERETELIYTILPDAQSQHEYHKRVQIERVAFFSAFVVAREYKEREKALRARS